MITNPHQGRDRLTLVLSYLGLFLVLYLAWRVVQPFVEPLVWAVILTVILLPLHQRLARRLGASRAALATIVLFMIVVSVPASFIIVALVRQSTEAAVALQQALSQGVPPALQQAYDRLGRQVPLPPQDQIIREITGSLDQIATWIAARAGRIVAGGVQFSLSLTVSMFALYFLLRDTEKLATRLSRLTRMLPFTDAQQAALRAQARDLVISSVMASFSVAIAQGTLGGIGFAITGIPSPVFWGVVMGFMSLLPLVGAASVWLPAALWLILSGHLPQGLLLVGIGAGVISTVDNFIRPAVLRGRSPLNVVVLFVSVLGGIGAFGFIGMIVGPVIVATALMLIEVYTGPDPTPSPAPPGEAPQIAPPSV